MNKQLYIFCIVFIILGFVFQTALQEEIEVFQWYDEIIAFAVFMHFVFGVITGKITKMLKGELHCILLMGILLIVGLIGNFNAKIETRMENYFYRYLC